MKNISTIVLIILGFTVSIYPQNNFSKRKISNLKNQVSQLVENDKKMTQVMVDKIFSFSELGFQEFETSKYVTTILEPVSYTHLTLPTILRV